jgi:hypothetical protein
LGSSASAVASPRLYIYADESGNFDFSPGGSRYFTLTTVTVSTFTVGLALQELRHDLAWEGVGLENDAFHATTDKQFVRDRVFEAVSSHDFRVDATILEKAKAAPHIRPTDERFYQMAWYQHMKFLGPAILTNSHQVLVVGASLGVKKKRGLFYNAIKNVMDQVSSTPDVRVACWAASAHPCLQLADYCAWAIQRKWEGGDPRSHILIANKIRSEFDVFRHGPKLYY